MALLRDVVRLGADGLPIVEWVPVAKDGVRDALAPLSKWGLWCRRCGAVEVVEAVPDGESGKTILVEVFERKHEKCP